MAIARTLFLVLQLLQLSTSHDAVQAALPESPTEEEALDEDCNVLLLQEKSTLWKGGDVDNTQMLVTATAMPASPPVGGALGRAPKPSDLSEGAVLEQALLQFSTASSLGPASGVQFSACAAEFIAMTLFVVIGCGSAMGIAKEEGSAWILQVSLTFGLAITSLAYAIGHYSGGQINCAVTLGLVVAGQCSVVQGILNFVAQMLGSLFGAWLLTVIYPEEKDLTGSLASNSVAPAYTWANAMLGEIIMTFLLVFVVLQTAVNPLSVANRQVACLAIGFAVFLAHTVLIPIDGCSINPTRSFGPQVMARIRYGKGGADHAVFWAGPLIGAVIAAGIYRVATV